MAPTRPTSTVPPRELGDFQTPLPLAREVLAWLGQLGVKAGLVLEPTCGVGGFLVAAAEAMPAARLAGFELQPEHVATARAALGGRAQVERADFFAGAWRAPLAAASAAGERVLVLGNPPWVTTAAVGADGRAGANQPARSVQAGHDGWSARTGDSNFDVAEWMVAELLAAVDGTHATVAMVCKRAVARRLVARIERAGTRVAQVHVATIDARVQFGASVDACVAVFRLEPDAAPGAAELFEHDAPGTPARTAMARRAGTTVRDVATFDRLAPALLDPSVEDVRWRSGIKHDAAAVLELRRADGVLRNGLGEVVDLEPEHVLPLLKGADIAAGRAPGDRWVVVPNRRVGDDTGALRASAPRTWAYLDVHRGRLDARRSSIYRRQPPFTVFGVGPYAFQPWRVAISALHKRLEFQLVGPHDGQPVQFDDTVYAVGLPDRARALEFLAATRDPARLELLDSMVFWADKRPIKARVLNAVRW